MRKPLLDKYRSAETALDAIRSQVIARELDAEPGPGFWATLWQELFVKPRLAWGGIGAIWLAVLFFSLTDNLPSSVRMADRREEQAPEIIQIVREQQRLREELLDVGVAAVNLDPFDRPREGLKPRSDKCMNQVMA